MRPDEVRRTAAYDSFAEECSSQLSSISVRVCHERCLAAEEYSLYTGFDHAEDDFHDYLDSSLSASKRAGISVQRTEGSIQSLPTTASRRVPEAGNGLHQEHSSI